MFVLAFDTTSEKGGVGIFRGGECLTLVPNVGPANLYSVSLFQMVDQAILQVRLQLGDIGLYAVANGPGSFTGIRVGLAAARAWGQAFSKPVRGVSTLDALAHSTRLTSDWAFPILDARRGEFFLQGYRRRYRENQDGRTAHYEPEDGGWVLRPADISRFFADRLPAGAGATCVVRSHDEPSLALVKSLPYTLGVEQVNGLLVETIASLALQAEEEGSTRAASSLDACYIRRPDAEIGWKG